MDNLANLVNIVNIFISVNMSKRVNIDKIFYIIVAKPFKPNQNQQNKTEQNNISQIKIDPSWPGLFLFISIVTMQNMIWRGFVIFILVNVF